MSKTGLEKFDAKEWYISNFKLFENSLNGGQNKSFHDIRKAALTKFADLGFPTPRNEEWKYTNVAPILEHKFKIATEPTQITKNALSKFVYEGLENNLVVFINGHFSTELSNFIPKPKGFIVDSLKNVLLKRPKIAQKYLGGIAAFHENSFTALNTAFTNDGMFMFVPREMIFETPILILHLADARQSPFSTHPRNLIVAEKGSQVQFIECYHTITTATYFNNLVNEVYIAENAKVKHIKIQEESEKAFHIANTQIQQERNSVYTSVNIDLGGALVRNNMNILLNAENCETNLFGFYQGSGTQHIDNHTFIDHAKPHCNSNELYKGILDGKAKGVFSGKIMVRPDAQKTNAFQSNKTLLLTNDATIHAKPQLEIFADDVKCSHGATIGQLDDEALFYLRARGISEKMAAAMLRFAFASDVFEKINIEQIRKRLDGKILDRLKNVDGD